jgi:hypothetical protein
MSFHMATGLLFAVTGGQGRGERAGGLEPGVRPLGGWGEMAAGRAVPGLTFVELDMMYYILYVVLSTIYLLDSNYSARKDFGSEQSVMVYILI